MAVPNLTSNAARAPGSADMRPCRQCGQTHPRRMIALMTLWFGQYAGLGPEGGYFYLCPSCYQRLIGPHADQIAQRLEESHPSGGRVRVRGRGMAPSPDDPPPAAAAPPIEVSPHD